MQIQDMIEHANTMKAGVLMVIGFLGGIIVEALGGWDILLQILLYSMAIDYVTGLILAGVFRRSEKTDTGGLSSKVGWKGLCKKIVTLAIVFLATKFDILFNMDIIRSSAIIAYTVNELVSITENAGLMGVPIPGAIKQAIDLLQKRAEAKDIIK